MENKVKAVYLPSACRVVSRDRSRCPSIDRWGPVNTPNSNRCSCSVSDCSLRSAAPFRSRRRRTRSGSSARGSSSEKLSTSANSTQPVSASKRSSSGNFGPRRASPAASRAVNGINGTCLTATVTTGRRRKPSPGRRRQSRSASQKKSAPQRRSSSRRGAANKMPRKRRSKNSACKPSVRKRAKSK